ncbi:MAG: hypothetical protein WAL31_04860 [Gaiellaceae bacterium]
MADENEQTSVPKTQPSEPLGPEIELDPRLVELLERDRKAGVLEER